MAKNGWGLYKLWAALNFSKLRGLYLCGKCVSDNLIAFPKKREQRKAWDGTATTAFKCTSGTPYLSF